MLTPEIISLYLPHAVKFKCKEGIGIIKALYPGEKKPIVCRNLTQGSWNYKDIKLILKPLTLITPEDSVNAFSEGNNYFMYLASKHYDIFNLIEYGDAVDIKILEEEVKNDK